MAQHPTDLASCDDRPETSDGASTIDASHGSPNGQSAPDATHPDQATNPGQTTADAEPATIERLLDQAMNAVTRAREQIKQGVIADLRGAAVLVDQCHTAMQGGDQEQMQVHQARLVGLLDEVEQLTQELIAEDLRMRTQMQSLNDATSAHRAYRGSQGG